MERMGLDGSLMNIIVLSDEEEPTRTVSLRYDPMNYNAAPPVPNFYKDDLVAYCG